MLKEHPGIKENPLQRYIEAVVSRQQDIEAFVSYAAIGDNNALIQFLDKFGRGIIDEKDDEGRTALTRAAQQGNKDTVELLLRGGASVDLKAKTRTAALYFAAHENHLEIITLLLDHGATIDQMNDGGFTPLACAASSGHTEAVKVLLARGADVHHTNGDNMTPLMFAAANGHTDIVALLLKFGADIHVQSKNARLDALALADLAGAEEIKCLLLDWKEQQRKQVQEEEFKKTYSPQLQKGIVIKGPLSFK